MKSLFCGSRQTKLPLQLVFFPSSSPSACLEGLGSGSATGGGVSAPAIPLLRLALLIFCNFAAERSAGVTQVPSPSQASRQTKPDLQPPDGVLLLAALAFCCLAIARSSGVTQMPSPSFASRHTKPLLQR